MRVKVELSICLKGVSFKINKVLRYAYKLMEYIHFRCTVQWVLTNHIPCDHRHFQDRISPSVCASRTGRSWRPFHHCRLVSPLLEGPGAGARPLHLCVSPLSLSAESETHPCGAYTALPFFWGVMQCVYLPPVEGHLVLTSFQLLWINQWHHLRGNICFYFCWVRKPWVLWGIYTYI